MKHSVESGPYMLDKSDKNLRWVLAGSWSISGGSTIESWQQGGRSESQIHRTSGPQQQSCCREWSCKRKWQICICHWSGCYLKFCELFPLCIQSSLAFFIWNILVLSNLPCLFTLNIMAFFQKFPSQRKQTGSVSSNFALSYSKFFLIQRKSYAICHLLFHK